MSVYASSIGIVLHADSLLHTEQVSQEKRKAATATARKAQEEILAVDNALINLREIWLQC